MTQVAQVKKFKMQTVGYSFTTKQITKISKDLSDAGYEVVKRPEMVKALMDGVEIAVALKLRNTWILRGAPGLFTPKEG